MGLDSFALNLDESGRVWHEAGFRFQLKESDFNRFEQSRTEISQQVTKPYRPTAKRDQQPSFKAGALSVTAHKPDVSQPAQPQSGKPAKAEPEWPNPWDVYKTSLKIPCRTVWTYWDLGWDMGTEPSEARRELLRNIMKPLYDKAGWQKGSITFWPMAAVCSKGLAPDPNRFWKGVKLTGASHIIVFGRRAFQTLFPDREFKFETFRHHDYTVVVLPGPGNVLADRDGAKAVVWHTLRQLDIR